MRLGVRLAWDLRNPNADSGKPARAGTGPSLAYIRIPLRAPVVAVIGLIKERKMDEPDQHETTPDPVIAEALEKNKDATDEVKKVADDLLVVHAVLKDELSQDTVTDEGGRAVEQAGELEKRL